MLRVSVSICSAQSKNRYNSGIVLRKVRIGTIPELSCAKEESVQFRNCLAQSKNSYFVRQFRNCTGQF